MACEGIFHASPWWNDAQAMDTHALNALREILSSTRYLLKHYEALTEDLSALADVQQCIDTALQQIDSALVGEAAAD